MGTTLASRRTSTTPPTQPRPVKVSSPFPPTRAGNHSLVVLSTSSAFLGLVERGKGNYLCNVVKSRQTAASPPTSSATCNDFAADASTAADVHQQQRRHPSLPRATTSNAAGPSPLPLVAQLLRSGCERSSARRASGCGNEASRPTFVHVHNVVVILD